MCILVVEIRGTATKGTFQSRRGDEQRPSSKIGVGEILHPYFLVSTAVLVKLVVGAEK